MGLSLAPPHPPFFPLFNINIGMWHSKASWILFVCSFVDHINATESERSGFRMAKEMVLLDTHTSGEDTHAHKHCQSIEKVECQSFRVH